MKYLETHTATICFERETGVALEKQHDDISEIKTLVRKLYTIAPRPETYGINFSIMPREKVARLKTLHGKDMKGFALHLEKLLYESHLDDLIKTVDKRLETVELVEFIKQCCFFYYGVREDAKETAWSSVKGALNSRVRRNRSTQNRVDKENIVQSDPFAYESE
ncbi:unnamed protein product [Nippostrongylus brasiliensis]|uniref:FH2 domain-containing protein n=1 Tax=Nippostrongylus brasiliensis TaxID=27835 RepID=A0A0N4Y258_NIPBR|nr:unnamed protein product [Nippostrongylus brasiliensis]